MHLSYQYPIYCPPNIISVIKQPALLIFNLQYENTNGCTKSVQILTNDDGIQYPIYWIFIFSDNIDASDPLAQTTIIHECIKYPSTATAAHEMDELLSRKNSKSSFDWMCSWDYTPPRRHYCMPSLVFTLWACTDQRLQLFDQSLTFFCRISIYLSHIVFYVSFLLATLKFDKSNWSDKR